jgi:hypothetical protein
VTATGTYFACPAEEASLDLVSITGGRIELVISDSGRLCTLVQISPDGLNFKPVARSYDGYDWESSAGDFATLKFTCGGDSCVANLPTLPAGSVYQLTSFDKPQLFLGDKDEIARFLEQTTFGPTRADIDSFDTSNLKLSFANWIKNQQDDVPLTSHRAIYRTHLNAAMVVATRQGAVAHPCQAGARYRRYAFSMTDYRKYMDIRTAGGKKILSVDGFVRTVVDGPITAYWDDSILFGDGRSVQHVSIHCE